MFFFQFHILPCKGLMAQHGNSEFFPPAQLLNCGQHSLLLLLILRLIVTDCPCRQMAVSASTSKMREDNHNVILMFQS